MIVNHGLTLIHAVELLCSLNCATATRISALSKQTNQTPTSKVFGVFSAASGNWSSYWAVS